MTPTDSAHQGSHGSTRYDDGVPHHQPGVHDELHNIDVDHEHIDVSLRAVVTFGAAIVMVTLGAAFAMWILFGIFARQEAAKDPELSPLAVPAGQLPPVPRLQTNEPATLQKLRASEQERLESYGWVDQGAGVTRIPIDEAKKKLLEHRLPTRSTAVDPSVGTHAPAMAESSGGRAIK